MKLFIASVLILVMCMTTVEALGQGKKNLEAVRIGMLTEQLNLTSEQAEKFWPLFNEYSLKRKTIKSNISMQRINAQAKQDLNCLKAILDLRQDDLILQRAYLDKFAKVLTVDQVIKLYQFEKEYARYLLHQMRRGRRNDGGQGMNGEMPD